MTIGRARCAALWTVLLLAAMAAPAQEGGGQRSGPPSQDDADRGTPERGSPAGEFNVHLQDVKQRLKLQSSQQAAWNTYARRVQALMEDVMRGVGRPVDPEDAVHQINRRVDLVRNRLAAMEDIADAATQLYAGLSPSQRKIADDLLPTTVPTLYSGLPDVSRPPPGPSIKRRRGP